MSASPLNPNCKLSSIPIADNPASGVRRTKRAGLIYFIDSVYSHPERFRQEVRNLLLLNCEPRHCQKALTALHPLFVGNRHGRIVAAMADAWCVSPIAVFEHFQTLPRDERERMNGVIDREMAFAREAVFPEILQSDPHRTEQLIAYEKKLRAVISRKVPPVSVQCDGGNPPVFAVDVLSDVGGVPGRLVTSFFRKLDDVERLLITRAVERIFQHTRESLADTVRIALSKHVEGEI